ncbi:MAG: cation:proton antiporter [Bacteroidales bacterium]|nr:cation:proton antiporter [Bacteroidales bacterium]
MEIPLLQDIIVIFSLSAVVILLFHRLKLPPIIGFIVTGIIIGPSGIIDNVFDFNIMSNDEHGIDYLAEIGVILLLFTIGIEFSIKNLLMIKNTVLIGGGLQVGLSIAFAYFIASAFGYDYGEAVFMGFLLALSSTAIVLRTLQKDNQITTSHGKASLGILIFQDVIIVPMMLLTPILAGNTSNVGMDLFFLLLKTFGLVIFTYVSSRWIIPKLLHEVAKTGSRELFLLTLLLLGFAIAWLSSSLGLSLALGAFLAGLAISESEYSHHAFGNIIPFRDLFTAFFFVSVGMLLDIDFVINEPVLVIAFVVFVIGIKTIVTGFATFVLGYPFKTTVIVGLSLSQIGEFSFVLSEIGLKNGFLISSSSGDFYYQLFLSVTTITMILTPFIIMSAPAFSKLMLSIIPIPEKFVKGLIQVPENKPEILNNHLIIIGMGLNGTNLSKAALSAGIPYIIVESDASVVEEKQAKGYPIIFGDATFENMLSEAGIERAMVLVSVINNPSDLYTIVKNARKLNPDIYIIARTRYLIDVEDLYKAGVNEVIPEEFETSLEIFARVLNKYLIPKSDIDGLIAQFRTGGYQVLRDVVTNKHTLGELEQSIPDFEITAVTVGDNSSLAGKSIVESGIRENLGVTVLAIRRNNTTISNPSKDEKFLKGDNVYFMGEHQKCVCAHAVFTGDPSSDCNS